MANLSVTRHRIKPRQQSTARFLRYDAGRGILSMRVTRADGRVVETAYSVEPIGSQAGDAFRLTKHVGHRQHEAPVYDVLLSDDGHTCDCGDGVYRDRYGVGYCKHVAALAKLRDLGRI